MLDPGPAYTDAVSAPVNVSVCFSQGTYPCSLQFRQKMQRMFVEWFSPSSKHRFARRPFSVWTNKLRKAFDGLKSMRYSCPKTAKMRALLYRLAHQLCATDERGEGAKPGKRRKSRRVRNLTKAALGEQRKKRRGKVRRSASTEERPTHGSGMGARKGGGSRLPSAPVFARGNRFV